MINDTKISGTFTNVSKINHAMTSQDVKNGTKYLATQLLDFIMTENNDFLVIGARAITNDTKYV